MRHSVCSRTAKEGTGIMGNDESWLIIRVYVICIIVPALTMPDEVQRLQQSSDRGHRGDVDTNENTCVQGVHREL
jgi:hypothetical protein